MRRRTFLKTCGSVLGLGLSGGAGMIFPLRGNDAWGQTHHSPGEMKRRGPLDLRYQGTHILTHGALRHLADRYNRLGPGRLTVAGGGCDDGITATMQGDVDLGGMCCPVEGSRAEGLNWLTVARDIKTVVTHPDNPLDGIGLQELRAVARGRILRWNELGGTDRPIALVVRRHCADFFEPVRQLLLDGEPAWSQRALFVDTDKQLIETVIRFRGAVGLVSWVFAQPMVAAGKLKILSVDGAQPSLAAVQNGGYTLTGPLNLIFSRWRAPAMAPFFDFLYGDEGAAIISRRLVPVSGEEAGYPRRV
jgi:phosphate transport system substrate-binding protein